MRRPKKVKRQFLLIPPFLQEKRMPSASAIRSYGTAFLAEDGGLSRVASGATCAALDSPPSGAILRRIGWPPLPHCRRRSELCRRSYVIVFSRGPTADWPRRFLSGGSPLHHQASIRTRVSPLFRTRCTLVSGTFWGCTLPNGICPAQAGSSKPRYAVPRTG
jgi:hypothetical protein